MESDLRSIKSVKIVGFRYHITPEWIIDSSNAHPSGNLSHVYILVLLIPKKLRMIQIYKLYDEFKHFEHDNHEPKVTNNKTRTTA